MVRQSLDDCRIKKESLSKIDEEMRRCEDILKILNVNSDITTNVTKDFKELDDLKAEVKELKQLLQNVSAVRPEVIKILHLILLKTKSRTRRRNKKEI